MTIKQLHLAVMGVSFGGYAAMLILLSSNIITTSVQFTGIVTSFIILFFTFIIWAVHKRNKISG